MWLFVAVALGKDPAPAPAPKLAPLPLGKSEAGTATDEKDALYGFDATGAGILTVATRGEGSDLAIIVSDQDGQPLPNGNSDQDLYGARGSEQLVVTLPSAGSYIVVIDDRGGDPASFHLAASFVAMPQAELPVDADGRPGGAINLAISESHPDSINPNGGDRVDWFSIQLKAAGTLTVLTKAPDGDLVLDAFTGGQYRDEAEHSDHDLQDVRGNESIAIHGDAGDHILFRVSSNSSSSDEIPYKISSGVIPD